MSAVKKYFKEEINLDTLMLEHPKPSAFYLSAWQTTRSPVPLLIWRTFLFIAAIGIVLSSKIIYILNGIYAFWFIYLTHWGLTIIVFATGFSVVVSARCYIYGPISADFKLPWYVKTYWVLHNIAVPVAFLITIFYWSVLYEAGIEEELSFGLDVAVHGLNTLVMFLVLVTTSQPTRLLHIYQPCSFALCYVLFGLIYFWAGGVNTAGNPWVYPVINWNNPGPTIGWCLLTGLMLAILHLVTMGISVARDFMTEKLLRPTPVQETVPLRQPAQNV